MRRKLEYFAVLLLIRGIGLLPRGLARHIGAGIGALAFLALPRLRRVGYSNLQIAFPELSRAQHTAILRGRISQPRLAAWRILPDAQYTPENTKNFLRYEGLEHYLAARDAGQGVLILTGHLGAWELSSFYHSLMGYPMSMVIRRLDNELVDQLVNGIRCQHGNMVLHKDDFARGLISAMRQGETVGILMDTNMTPPQGVFVDFFGAQACTASGMARVALGPAQPCLPGFLIWDDPRKAMFCILAGSSNSSAAKTTTPTSSPTPRSSPASSKTTFASIPGQWLWLHRRWKTRPEGQPPIY